MENSTTLPSIWTSINNWCTPTIVFFFLNLMIATILFTSNLPNNNTNTNNQNKQQNQKIQTQNEPNKLARSPSILNRLRSFNLHPYRSQNDQQHPIQQEVQEEQDALELAATQYVFDHPFPEQQDPQPQPIPVSPKPDLDPNRFDKTKKVQPQSEPVFKAQTHFINDRHTTENITTHVDFGPTHLEKPLEKPTHYDFDVDVDAKADDFIKKFKNHLKLQRLDAIIRYKDMVNRAAKAAKAAVDDVDVDAKADDFIRKFKGMFV